MATSTLWRTSLAQLMIMSKTAKWIKWDCTSYATSLGYWVLYRNFDQQVCCDIIMRLSMPNPYSHYGQYELRFGNLKSKSPTAGVLDNPSSFV